MALERDRPSNWGRAGLCSGSHENQALKTLMALLAPLGIRQFYTDAWGAYLRLLDLK